MKRTAIISTVIFAILAALPLTMYADSRTVTHHDGGPMAAFGAGGEIDTLAPIDDEATARIYRLIEASLERYTPRSDSPAARTAGVSYNSTKPSIKVTYDPAATPPQNVKDIVEAVADRWSEVLELSPNGPVEIYMAWNSFGNTSVLGYAGSTRQFSNGPLPPGKLFPAALTNTIIDDDAWDQGPEIQMAINSDLLASGGWHISMGNEQPGIGTMDLYSVILHEVGHGLGFAANVAGSGHNVYDELLYTGTGSKFIDLTDQSTPLTSNDLYIKSGAEHRHKVHAPSIYSAGSSVSHFNESSYPNGTPGSLMTPFINARSHERTIDAPTVGVLSHIGWPVEVNPINMTVALASATDSEILINHSLDLSQLATIPDRAVVRLYSGSNLVKTVDVNLTASGTSLAGLAPSTQYRIEVTTYRGQKTSTTTLLGSTSTMVTPATVRPVALDGQVARLYQAYFLRQPDQSGFSYWLNQRANGISIAAISNNFQASSEFASQYGAISDAEFVDLIYQNVLGRQSDASGRQYWINVLAQGHSRGTVMVGFSDSAEFIATTGTTGLHDLAEGKIRRLYDAIFQRQADAAGLAYWVDIYYRGHSLSDIAGYFTRSSEYQQRYGNTTNSQFVVLLYNNVLDRSPDQAGEQYWVDILNNGHSRGDVVVYFSESVENIIRTGYLP